MAKIILVDDFGTEEVINYDDILLKSHPFEEEAQQRITQALDNLPVGEHRSGMLTAMRLLFVQDYFLDKLFCCEACDKVVLASNLSYDTEADATLCKECAGK